MKKGYSFLIIVFMAISLVFSCGKTKSQEKVKKTNNAGKFMKANMPSISTHKLDNGINVIVKKQDTNRILTLKLVYSGGLALIPKGKDGIESLTLSSMLRGSKNYSFEDIKRISFENSSGMGSGTGIDMSSLSLTSIDKYWDSMFDMFSDAVINPVFDPNQVNIVKQDMQMAIKKDLSDPYAFTVQKLHEKTFKGHPYLIAKDGTEKSINLITLDEIKKWHSEKLTAERMFIVAVGNFEPEKLVTQLNKSFGKIPVKKNKIPEVKKLEIPSAVYTQEFPSSKGIAYIRGDYVIPAVDTKDFTTLRLAYVILDELLFDVVRTQNAACYSVWSNAHWFKSAYGSFVVFKSDKPTLAKTSFDKAIAILASGNTINLKGQGIKTGEGRVTKSTGKKYAPIAENIEAYKAKFINGFYSGQVTNSAVAEQIGSSQFYFGNSYEYLKFIDKINAITAEDVVRVVNKYIVNGKISWMIVGDEGILSKVDKSKFTQFTGKVEK